MGLRVPIHELMAAAAALGAAAIVSRYERVLLVKGVDADLLLAGLAQDEARRFFQSFGERIFPAAGGSLGLRWIANDRVFAWFVRHADDSVDRGALHERILAVLGLFD